MTALNPIMTIGEQLEEVVIKHKKASKHEAKKIAVGFLETVGVRSDRYNDYPHQFSGGMKQRVVIAMSLLCNPEILIADEPTTALDVTIQAQVLKIIKELINKYNMSMLLITHDLGVVAETCDRVAIMYAGEIVETGSVYEVYKYPKHPYTRGLFDSIPKLDIDEEKLVPIEGLIPNSADLPCGCHFHPRCKYKQDICKTIEPEIKGEDHLYKCHFSLF
ncbi:Oligopeptide transport ATP-binding protein OppD [bioreactor metagenome]|uniref:Oligopeptide transport ATP-binding protein OppD n=2 Tax=root TaxID=1 RepID=A0A645EW63_9ZZZZ